MVFEQGGDASCGAYQLPDFTRPPRSIYNDCMNHQALLRMFRYNHWANQESLRVLTLAAPAGDKAFRLYSHIIAAEWLWYGRIRNESSRLAVWPDLDINRCQKETSDIAKIWQAYLQEISTDELQRQVQYVNSQEETWSNRVEDILNHVILHSAGHRAQLAMELRNAGSTPAYTDFIHAVRRGFFDDPTR